MENNEQLSNKSINGVDINYEPDELININLKTNNKNMNCNNQTNLNGK